MTRINKSEWISQEKEYHNSIAKSRAGKDTLCWSYFEYRHLFRDLIKRLRHYKSIGKIHKLLDFGCAEGNQLKCFVDQRVYGYKYYGTDISDKLIDMARENNPDAVFRISNGETIPYESSFFDFVVCLGVLHHVPDIERSFSELIRVAKSDGYIYIREPMWIRQGKGGSPFERGIQFSEIADLINKNKANILKCNFSHNSLLFFLINHLSSPKIRLSLDFWRTVFITDSFINTILVNRFIPISFYRKLRIRPACFNVIVQKNENIND